MIQRKRAADLLPVMDPAFNYRELAKQLILLEDHLFHPRKRCPDCIWKHLLTAEALAEEAVTLDVDGKFGPSMAGLSDRIRVLQRAVQDGVPMVDIAQKAREIRKGLLPIAARMRVASVADPRVASVATRFLVREARRDPLDERYVESLRRDFLTLVRNVDRVQSVPDALRLKKALNHWRDLLGEYGHQIRQDLETRLRRKEFDPGWLKHHLDNMKHFWELHYELTRFPFEHPDLSRRRRPGLTDEDLLVQYQREVPKWAARVRRKAQAAWRWMKELSAWLQKPTAYLGAGGDGIDLVTTEEERTSLEGFQVVFRGFDDASMMQEYLPALKEALRRYRRRAQTVLPLILQHHLPIVVDWTWKGETGWAAGRYERTHILLTPWGLGKDVDNVVRILAHEMGHHLYKNYMSREMQDFWHTAIRGDYRDLDLRYALQVMRSVGADWIIDKAIMRADPILHLQLMTLEASPTYQYFDLTNVDAIETYLGEGKDPVVRVPANPISGYAAKNTEEAFCEAVGKLVAYGPKALPDKVLGWLKLIFPNIRFAKQNPLTIGEG